MFGHGISDTMPIHLHNPIIKEKCNVNKKIDENPDFEGISLVFQGRFGGL